MRRRLRRRRRRLLALLALLQRQRLRDALRHRRDVLASAEHVALNCGPRHFGHGLGHQTDALQ